MITPILTVIAVAALVVGFAELLYQVTSTNDTGYVVALLTATAVLAVIVAVLLIP